MNESDLLGIRVTDEYSSRQFGHTYIYLQQTLNGIDIEGATANGVIKAGTVYHLNQRFLTRVAERNAATSPLLNALAALRKAAEEVGITLPEVLEMESLSPDPDQKTIIRPAGFAGQPVQVRLIYTQDEKQGLRLSWEVELLEKSGLHFWLFHIDAIQGTIISRKDQVLRCGFDTASGSRASVHPYHTAGCGHTASPEDLLMGGTYHVFPQPIASPDHGNRALVTDPADPLASPFGWHDINGFAGAEYTITRGNNVHVYPDTDNNNSSDGTEPNGGSDLYFDYAFDTTGTQLDLRDAAMVNLFYWCNLMHDVWYQYGFDEAAGNFQQINYGPTGEGGDYIRAEGHDGGGLNNANFTLAGGDGSYARMQMYLYSEAGVLIPNSLYVNSPPDLAGYYGAPLAEFGPGLAGGPVTADLVLVDDGSFNPSIGCFPLVNGDDLAGNIALVDRGVCTFVQKVKNAQSFGAIGVIVCNDTAGSPFEMDGTDPDIVIPSLMISLEDCQLLKAALSEGVNVTFDPDGAVLTTDFKDSSFDNGIICHEYGHGISLRLSGGPSVGNGCLNNAEQMGEGWSDFFGLVMTMETGDAGEDGRGVSNYAWNQPPDGPGIRPAPYSTDPDINDYTYGDTNDNMLAGVHSLGFVWCTMLWDLTWALIDEYGFDPDIYAGTGGNNKAMQLVVEGLKLQACDPGFVDGRDGILLADQLLYDGAHQCLIWEVFAHRGLGYSADQGSPYMRYDQTEAFDLPPWCGTAVGPPVANFEVDYLEGCVGQIFSFINTSLEFPSDWLWDFGDGTTSEAFNPLHVYSDSGVYVVQLSVANEFGTDTTTLSLQVYVTEPATPGPPVTACEGTVAQLTAAAPNKVFWYLDGYFAGSGDTLFSPPLANGTVVEVVNAVVGDLTTGGPPDNSIDVGSYSNGNAVSGLKFEALRPFSLYSVLVYAEVPGERTIGLYDESSNLLDSIKVFLPAGPSQVGLNLRIEQPGEYILGGRNLRLFYNWAGADYPYLVGDFAMITSSTSSGYFCFYNWEVIEIPCESEPVVFDLTVEDAPDGDLEYIQGGATFLFSSSTDGVLSWYWDFGDGNTSTEATPFHTYADNGHYLVTLIMNLENEDCEAIAVQEVEVDLTMVEGPLQPATFELFPVPGDGTPLLQLSFTQPEDIEVRVFNSIGQVVWQDRALGVQRYEQRLKLNNEPSGTYFVELKTKSKKAFKRYLLLK